MFESLAKRVKTRSTLNRFCTDSATNLNGSHTVRMICQKPSIDSIGLRVSSLPTYEDALSVEI
jgi:hypothetical protein